MAFDPEHHRTWHEKMTPEIMSLWTSRRAN
jgi:hypothetical protein